MPQIWTLLIFLEKFRKQQLHQVEADSSVQNSLPIPRLPVLLREMLQAEILLSVSHIPKSFAEDKTFTV